MPSLQPPEPYHPLATQDSALPSFRYMQPAAPYQPYPGTEQPPSSTSSTDLSFPMPIGEVPGLQPPAPYQPFVAPSMTDATPVASSDAAVTTGGLQPPVSYDPFSHLDAMATSSATTASDGEVSVSLQVPAPYRPIERRAAGLDDVDQGRVPGRSSKQRYDVDDKSSIRPYSTAFATATLAQADGGTKTISTSSTSPMSFPLSGFPDWSPLMVCFMITFMFVLWLLAILLYFATFPPHNGWLTRRFRRNGRQKKGDGYVGLRDYDSDEGSDFEDQVMRGEVHMGHLAYLHEKAKRRRAEKQKWVAEVVNSDEEPVGLGIASASGTNCYPGQLLRQRRRRSLDLDLRMLAPPYPQEPSKVDSGSNAGPVSAPLPLARSFDSSPSSSNLSKSSSEEDLESGTHTPRPQPSPQTQPKGGKVEGHSFTAWLETVNAGIEYAAVKLARAAHDHVVAPEEGLLLPVRDGEREVMAGS